MSFDRLALVVPAVNLLTSEVTALILNSTAPHLLKQWQRLQSGTYSQPIDMHTFGWQKWLLVKQLQRDSRTSLQNLVLFFVWSGEKGGICRTLFQYLISFVSKCPFVRFFLRSFVTPMSYLFAFQDRIRLFFTLLEDIAIWGTGEVVWNLDLGLELMSQTNLRKHSDQVPLSYLNFSIGETHCGELKHYDWLKLVTRLSSSNQSAISA